MMRTNLRRFCFLVVALALAVGAPIPVGGAEAPGMTPQSVPAMAADGPPCGECECCDSGGVVDTATCAMGCNATVASLPDAAITEMTVSALSYVDALNRHSGYSPAPDPSPPKFPILT